MIQFCLIAEEGLKRAANELNGKYGFGLSDAGVKTRLSLGGTGIKVTSENGGLTVTVQKRVQAFYALKRIADECADGAVPNGYGFVCDSSFRDLNYMFDCSRNAVPKTETVEETVRLLAVMGYDTFMLYTEDTFAVKSQPYFGYLRNPFSGEDIRRFDEYCKLFGIELVPCIQTLAHFNSIVRYPAMGHLFDFSDILMVGEESTYRFVEDLISTCASYFSSRRIHIGMDEAYMLGRGKYMDKHGARSRYDIMSEHLARVNGICKKYGFHAMIWSDMFFSLTLSAQYGGELPAEVVEKIPADVDLYYWDYCSTEPEHFEAMMNKHRVFPNTIGFAGGATKWHGYTPDNRYSIASCEAAAKACVKTGIRDYIVTGWGDNGAECSPFAVLPTLLACSRFNYGDFGQDEAFAKSFFGLTGVPYEEFIKIDLGNRVTEHDDVQEKNTANKYLLFNDILLGTLDTIIDEGQGGLYAKHAEELGAAAERAGRWRYLFETQRALCEVLAIKADLGIKLRGAYQSGDKPALAAAYEKLRQLPERIEAFYELLRAQWEKENRPNGFDVQDIRIGALKQRVQVAMKKVGDYLSGKAESVPELGEKLLCFMGNGERFEKDYDQCEFRWRRMTSVNVNE